MLSNIDFLRKIIDTIDEGVIIQNIKGEIVAFNDRASDILEHPGGQLQGWTFDQASWVPVKANGEAFPYDEIPTVLTHNSGVSKKDILVGLKRPDFTIKWLRVNTHCMQHGGENVFFSTFLDVTETYNLQREIKYNKEPFKSGLKGSQLGVWHYSKQTDEVFYSDEWKTLLGYKPEELDNTFQQWVDLLHPDSRDYAIQVARQFLEGRTDKLDLEIKLLCKDKSYKWIHSTGTVITRTREGKPESVAGTHKDITDTKAIIELLKASEKQFSNVFHYSAVGMSLVSPDGNWIDVNPATCNMLGYSKDELLRLNFVDITYPNDIEPDLANVRRMLNKEISTYSMEKRYIHKEGHIVWALLTVSLVWNDSGKPKFFIAQIQDITNSKELITQLEEKNKQLKIQAIDLENKFEQLEEFNRIVAHNLRGPVGNILMIADMLVEDTNAAELYAPMLQEATTALDNTLGELIQILEIKLTKNVRYEDCRISDVLSNVLNILKPQCDGIVIKRHLQVEELYYPKLYLESIIYNLLSNAVKYRRTHVVPCIAIKTYVENEAVVLEVIDNGLGIDLEKYGHQIFKLHKVFHKGFDSKGLGLSKIKTQIETLGGRINVQSLPNKGSTFKVVF